MSQTLPYEYVRNEAIQMFRDLPDNLRQELYNGIIQAGDTPQVLKMNSMKAYVFKMNIIGPKTWQHWKEFNEILFDLVLDTLSATQARQLTNVVHRVLTQTLNQNPTETAKNTPPPPVRYNQTLLEDLDASGLSWDEFLEMNPTYMDALEIAGLPKPFASGNTMTTSASGQGATALTGTTGVSGSAAAGTGGRRKMKRTRQSRKQRKQQRKSRKH